MKDQTNNMFNLEKKSSNSDQNRHLKLKLVIYDHVLRVTSSKNNVGQIDTQFAYIRLQRKHAI